MHDEPQWCFARMGRAVPAKNVDAASCSVAYEYDILNRRVSRIKGGETNDFVYNGSQVDADLDENGDLLSSYVWGTENDNLLALRLGIGLFWVRTSPYLHR